MEVLGTCERMLSSEVSGGIYTPIPIIIYQLKTVQGWSRHGGSEGPGECGAQHLQACPLAKMQVLASGSHASLAGNDNIFSGAPTTSVLSGVGPKSVKSRNEV